MLISRFTSLYSINFNLKKILLKIGRKFGIKRLDRNNGGGSRIIFHIGKLYTIKGHLNLHNTKYLHYDVIKLDTTDRHRLEIYHSTVRNISYATINSDMHWHIYANNWLYNCIVLFLSRQLGIFRFVTSNNFIWNIDFFIRIREFGLLFTNMLKRLYCD